VSVGGEASTGAIREALGMIKFCGLIVSLTHLPMLVRMQDAVNEMNKLNRVSSHLPCVDQIDELAVQVIVCMRTLGIGFRRQTRQKIK
jgi:hypothetical protein